MSGKCRHCGLPENRRSLCDRWDCGTYLLTSVEVQALPPDCRVIPTRPYDSLFWLPHEPDIGFVALTRDVGVDSSFVITCRKSRSGDAAGVPASGGERFTWVGDAVLSLTETD